MRSEMSELTCLTCGARLPARDGACPTCRSPHFPGEAARLGLAGKGAVRWEREAPARPSRRPLAIALGLVGLSLVLGAAVEVAFGEWPGFAAEVAGLVAALVYVRRARS